MASTSAQKTSVKIVLGGMTFGELGKDSARVTDVADIQAIMDIFTEHGHTEVDTSRFDAKGSSEGAIAKAGWKQHGLSVSTKLFPTTSLHRPGIPQISHSPEDIEKYIDISLHALQTDSIDLWYLQAPDRTTPFEVTLKAVNEQYKAGKFKKFGICSYMSWEVAEIMEICKTKGYVAPTAYQGLYNALQRNVEPELISCLRKYGISFYAFNPLGGGFLTGRYHSLQDVVPTGSRFDAQRNQGKAYRVRYWNETYFAALAKLEAVASKYNIPLAEIALRWISHHSVLEREHGDAVLIGASSVKHVEQNLLDLEKGPLPEEILQVLDEAWRDVALVAAKYYFE